jgi:hypothetical protein
MAARSRAYLPLPAAVAGRRKISVGQAAEIAGIHEDTWRKHYSHLILKLGPRLERVNLEDALSVGEPKDFAVR